MSRHLMLGFQGHPTIELPGTLKKYEDEESEIKSLIKTKWSQIACTTLGILHDGNLEICI